MALAYYGGPTGSLAEIADPELADDNDLYFTFNQSGTSFSSPIVAGGVALLKDLVQSGVYHQETPEALDSRVMMSVVMAGAETTVGWNNGQVLGEDGVIRTTQSLDPRTGAGRIDLEESAFIFVDGTSNLTTSGGDVQFRGWDFGEVALEGFNEYRFATPFDDQFELTLSLNWFVNRSYDEINEVGTEESFANLDLELWRLEEGLFDTLVASSESLYNNAEFLRLDIDEPGHYGFRVVFDGVVYDLSDSLDTEEYAVAWTVTVIPEPGTGLLVFSGVLILLRRHRFRPCRGCGAASRKRALREQEAGFVTVKGPDGMVQSLACRQGIERVF